MKKMVVGLALMLAATVAVAQEEEASETESRREPARKIRVLEHPYQIASFYRSSDAPVAPIYFGAAPLTERGTLTERYPIAGFYRQGGGQGRYSGYWNSPTRSSRGYGHRSRRMGAADLCLMVPTLLAPVAPFTNDGR